MCYSNAYRAVFRNSGFALATVVLRLALAAPDDTHAALGFGAALYTLGLNWVYNQFEVTLDHKVPEQENGPWLNGLLFLQHRQSGCS